MNKIQITENKEELVKELESRMKNTCSDQTCWLRTDFVKAMNDEEIENDTFRPEGPSNKKEWLSTTDINNVVSQYQEKFKDFLFLGAVPADFLELEILGIKDLDFHELNKEGKNKIGMVINLDESWKSGSHWVALYANLDKDQIYYFDSFGKKPHKRTKKFINKIFTYMYKSKFKKNPRINDIIKGGAIIKDFDVKYNSQQHQFSNTECGVYSMNFIIRLVRGETFEEITNNITKDAEMNKCRDSYFRN
jgi:hypothetical protein